ncbi:MAG: lipase secretion chaperone [Rhodoferax sp.]
MRARSRLSPAPAASWARKAALTCAAMALAAGAWWWWSPAPERAVDYRPGRDGALAQSHEGTTPDGDLALWGNGQATLSQLAQSGLPYAELRRLFDYFLSAWGEQDLPAIVARIHEELGRQLQGPQRDAARTLLGKYLDYKRALVDLDAKPQYAGQGVGAIRERFSAMLALRARIFTPQEDAGMFGFDDAYDRDALARLEIHQDKDLSAEEKRQRLAVLDAAMPVALREERDAPRRVVMVEEQVAQMRAQGATEAEVFALRAKAFDKEAARRLAEVDREEQAWAQRIRDYLGERQRVVAGLSQGQEREAALAQLQQSRFSAEELPRLVAYDSP